MAARVAATIAVVEETVATAQGTLTTVAEQAPPVGVVVATAGDPAATLQPEPLLPPPVPPTP